MKKSTLRIPLLVIDWFLSLLAYNTHKGIAENLTFQILSVSFLNFYKAKGSVIPIFSLDDRNRIRKK
jgi:hypothetical protein